MADNELKLPNGIVSTKFPDTVAIDIIYDLKKDALTSSNESTCVSNNYSVSNRKQCCSRQCFVGFLRRNLLVMLLILSLGVGIGLGAAMRSLDPPLDARQQMYFKFPGDILMRMLKAIIIPLIVSSLISGVAGLGASASGRIGVIALIYYIVTTLCAVLLGILLVSTIQPGFRSRDTELPSSGGADEGNIADSFLDLIRNMLPDNVVEACFRQTKTYQVPRNVFNMTACGNVTNDCNYTYVVYDFDTRKEDGMNVLGLVVFSLAIGIVLSIIGEVGKPLHLFCQALAEATMCLVSVIIWYSPIGVFFLIAAEIVSMTDPIAELRALGYYMLTVLVGLLIHSLIVLPLFYLVIVRRNPYTFIANGLQAFVTAFGTSSSTATLPITYKCLEERSGLDRRVTRFILPVGATINMDGTALYEAVAAIFIAQLNDIHLNAAQIVTTSITATLASIGAASVPQAGLVTMVMVLSALGLPAEEVAKILAIDWLLDRFRTMANVEGDCFGAGIVSHLCRHQLQQQDHESDDDDDDDNDNERSIDEYRSGATEGHPIQLKLDEIVSSRL